MPPLGIWITVLFSLFVLLCSTTGTNSVNVVTLASIEIFNAHEWFPSKPTVYFHCQGENNKTVLPDVKKTNFLYTFKVEESWQPLTELPDQKCKRCGFYEKDKFKSDDIFDEWELCPSDFVDGKYRRFKENEFNATFMCPLCTSSAASDAEENQNSSFTKHKKRNVALIVIMCALASLIAMAAMVAAYRYWQKRKREEDQARFLKLFEEGDDDDIDAELSLEPVL